MNLTNQHIVIAGGSSGIGFAIAELALKQGAQVTLIGRSADKLAAAKQRLGGNPKTLAFDIGDANLAQKGFVELGAFDHFVSTAADLTYGPLATMERSAIEQMLASKFWGPVNLVQFALPHMAPGGSILFFSGLAANRPATGTSMVSALNAGIEGMTRALALELSPIRVNAISPGVVDTEGWSFMEEPERRAFFADLTAKLPAKRVGVPEDLAEAALFALSNRYLTGATLCVDGGGSFA